MPIALVRGGRLLAVAVAACVLVVPSPSARATAPPSLREWTQLTGTSGFVDVVLTQKAPLDSAAIGAVAPTNMTISGDPAAMVVVASQRFLLGADEEPWTAITKFPRSVGNPVVYWHRRDLQPGRYRVYLLARQRTTVRFRLPGLPRGQSNLATSGSARGWIAERSGATEAISGVGQLHTNTIEFSNRRDALFVSMTWSKADQPLVRVGVSCTHYGKAAATALACAGGAVSWYQELYPSAPDTSLRGGGIAPLTPDDNAFQQDIALIGEVDTVGSRMYALEY